MTALIDADSLIYIIAYNHKNSSDESEVKKSCSNFLSEIVTLTRADNYLGVFSGDIIFRHSIYKYAPYKGNRREKDEWVVRWGPIIKSYYTEKYGFVALDGLEADDIVSALSQTIPDCIICSPDKDLKQVPGLHYNYAKSAGSDKLVYKVSEEEADKFFWTQVIMGDMGDNVYGVPGLGEIKAVSLLNEANDPIEYPFIAEKAYIKYFGHYYGQKIFNETLDTLLMMGPKHKYWGSYLSEIIKLKNNFRILDTGINIFDVN